MIILFHVPSANMEEAGFVDIYCRPATKSHHYFTCEFIVAGGVELPHVELQADDGEHEDGHEQQQSDLQQGDHGLHNGLEHHLQAWRTQRKTKSQDSVAGPLMKNN